MPCVSSVLVTAALFVGSFGLQSAQKPDNKIRLFVFTAVAGPSDFVPPDQRQRVDSKNNLQGNLKGRSSIRLVDAEGGADVTLEVLARGMGSEGQWGVAVPMYGGGAVMVAGDNQYRVVRARLRVRGAEYVIDLQGKGLTWDGAANDVAKQVERWCKENRGRLGAK